MGWDKSVRVAPKLPAPANESARETPKAQVSGVRSNALAVLSEWNLSVFKTLIPSPCDTLRVVTLRGGHTAEGLLQSSVTAAHSAYHFNIHKQMSTPWLAPGIFPIGVRARTQS